MQSESSVEEMMDEFCQDRTSGSLPLLKSALMILMRICKEKTNADERLRMMLSYMRKCHGDMALITNAAAETEDIIKRSRGVDYFPKIIEYAEREIGKTANSLRGIGNAVADIVRHEVRIATISRSQTVLDTVISLHGKGLVKNVLISESRPMQEGVKMAVEIAESGINVTIVADAAMDAMLENVDICIIGADAFDHLGNIRNKIGSRSLALSCLNRKIPLAVICQPEKSCNLLPNSMEQHDLKELVHDPLPENVSVSNFYFENVERDLIDFLVIGERIFRRGEPLTP